MTFIPTDIKKLEKIVNKLVKEAPSHGLGRALRFLSKEIHSYKKHLLGIEKLKKQKNAFNTKKIQIGGGKHMLKGFLNIDIAPPADLICDIREGIPLPNECCKFIFSEHFLEHLDYPTSAKKIIKEFFRILKHSGKLIIGVPDSKLVIKNYIKSNNAFYKKAVKCWFQKRKILPHLNTYIDLVNYNFRDQEDDKKYGPHLWVYDYEKLNLLLKNAGFSKVKKWKFNKKIANPKRKFGTLYVMATK